jgi:hypothetical protein
METPGKTRHRLAISLHAAPVAGSDGEERDQDVAQSIIAWMRDPEILRTSAPPVSPNSLQSCQVKVITQRRERSRL